MRRRARLGLTCLALLVLTGAAPRAGAEPQLVATLALRSQVDGFGGFSGLEVNATGTRLTSVSDRGLILQAEILRDADGRPVAVEDLTFGQLLSPEGTPMARWRSDAEGLAIDQRGRGFVSFEGDEARIWRYDPLGGPAQPLPTPPRFDSLQGNSGLEALAVLPDGTLLTIPERSGQLDLPFPVWRYRAGRWDQPFSVPRLPPHLPVGLDIGPDGRMYLLERHFGGLAFSTRVRRFELRGDRLGPGEILLETPLGLHSNLEGIAVWRDSTNAIRLTLISDNNFLSLLATELAEYRLPPAP